jgi:hypothetical protein
MLPVRTIVMCSVFETSRFGTETTWHLREVLVIDSIARSFMRAPHSATKH